MMMCVNAESTTTALFGLSGDREDFMHLRHSNELAFFMVSFSMRVW